MSYLVDTDWCADFLVDRAIAVQLFRRLAPEGLAISIATYGELYEGVLYGRDRDAQDVGFRQFLLGVEVLPLTTAVMQRFAEVRGRLRRDGNLIGYMDLLIAATAITHDLTLVTRNTRHFERIPGLELYQRS